MQSTLIINLKNYTQIFTDHHYLLPLFSTIIKIHYSIVSYQISTTLDYYNTEANLITFHNDLNSSVSLTPKSSNIDDSTFNKFVLLFRVTIVNIVYHYQLQLSFTFLYLSSSIITTIRHIRHIIGYVNTSYHQISFVTVCCFRI